MRYIVVERFKAGRIGDVYQHFDERGRMMPDGLNYLDPWISADLAMCWQLVETEDPSLVAKWTRNCDEMIR